MADAILDASALLAFLKGEPGAEHVAASLPNSAISAINLAEVIGKLVEHGKPADAAAYHIERLKLDVVPFDAEQAKLLGSIWKPTRDVGLSLADRACLALGLKLNVPVLTADRAWEKVEVGVAVRLIR